MRDPNERETWMATLLTKGAAEASAEIGASVVSEEALSIREWADKSEQRFCDWVNEHNWQRTYTAIVEGKTIETIGKGAFEFSIAVPDGMVMKMHKLGDQQIISFEPAPRQPRNWDGSYTTLEAMDAAMSSGYALTRGLFKEPK